ncbi:hypothetical protein [Desulfosporosinus meridiei]|uniref:Uncharacterized protein n=1 Tax=Desulfosporosinus meridiei (strain ATCC BAA-275 / DSM 13257 / KCTC 12902 / NCIMB 13706 / S10) TaxID=768704 RepID=J7J089_DESMD|nr:hypothetical protein [Desulfosporosinus meridiei]AFQ44356.1 hypothetical protein Desmer_2437 [Desulfosporosinus meridiei DSM 13257]
MLKTILGTMIALYLFIFWLGYPIGDLIFPGGGVAESYLKPIYMGIVVLGGLIVACTCHIAKRIEGLKSDKEANE